MAAEPEGLLVDTNLLLWWASMPEILPAAAKTQFESCERPLVFGELDRGPAGLTP